MTVMEFILVLLALLIFGFNATVVIFAKLGLLDAAKETEAPKNNKKKENK